MVDELTAIIPVEDEVTDDPEEEPTVFETLEDAEAALGELPVVGPTEPDLPDEDA